MESLFRAIFEASSRPLNRIVTNGKYKT